MVAKKKGEKKTKKKKLTSSVGKDMDGLWSWDKTEDDFWRGKKKVGDRPSKLHATKQDGARRKQRRGRNVAPS